MQHQNVVACRVGRNLGPDHFAPVAGNDRANRILHQPPPAAVADARIALTAARSVRAQHPVIILRPRHRLLIVVVRHRRHQTRHRHVVEHNAVSVIAHGLERHVIIRAQVRQRKVALRPRCNAGGVFRQLHPARHRRRPVQHPQNVLIGEPLRLGMPEVHVRARVARKIHGRRNQPVGDTLGRAVEQGVVGAAMRCRRVATVPAGAPGPFLGALDQLPAPARRGHSPGVFEILGQRVAVRHHVGQPLRRAETVGFAAPDRIGRFTGNVRPLHHHPGGVRPIRSRHRHGRQLPHTHDPGALEIAQGAAGAVRRPHPVGIECAGNGRRVVVVRDIRRHRANMRRRARIAAGVPPNPIARLAVNICPAQAHMIRVGALGRRQVRHRRQLPVTGIGIARGTDTNRVGRHNPVVIERPNRRARVVVGRDVRRIRVNRRRRSKHIRRMAIDDKPGLLGAVVVPAQSHVRRLRAVRSRQTRRFRRRPRQGRHIGHRRVAPRAFRPGRRHPPVVRHRIRQPRHHHACARHRTRLVAVHAGRHRPGQRHVVNVVVIR